MNKKPVPFDLENVKNQKRTKQNKNLIQMIYFKNLHDRIKYLTDNKIKSQMIKSAAKVLNMQKR